MPIGSLASVEAIHPALWRASQLARGVGDYADSGHAVLARELPGGGWPLGQLTEILLAQNGSAELRLLAPALRQLGPRTIVLLTPPYQPQPLALAEAGLQPAQLLWLRCHKHLDALWAAEQILRSGSCGALLFWQAQIRSEALRRLHLATQASAALFFLMRPEQAAQQPSPAPLRISLRPMPQGLQLRILKRRGIQLDSPLLLDLPVHPYLHSYEQQQRGVASLNGDSPARMPTVDSRVPALAPA